MFSFQETAVYIDKINISGLKILHVGLTQAFCVSFFSLFHCINPRLFSANIVTSSLTITLTRASSRLNSSIVSSPAPIVKSSEKSSLIYDLVSSCFSKSLFSWGLRFCLEVAFVHVLLSVGKT